MKKIGFTLAEVLITLAIIGVVAAMTIPAVIVNTNQQEFKTGLRKAVSVLNSAITMNKALTGESPYDNGDLYNYLQQHMSIMSITKVQSADKYSIEGYEGEYSDYNNNWAFYTTDGMRFEFQDCGELGCDNMGRQKREFPLYESNETAKLYSRSGFSTTYSGSMVCGSKGLAHNPDGTNATPCIITVDVNGDRKPSYPDPKFSASTGITTLVRKFQDPNGRLLSDLFSIMITDQGAIPYGVVAQKAMYQAQK